MKKVQSIVLCLLLSVAMIMPSGLGVFAADGIPAGETRADGAKTVLTENEGFPDKYGDEWDDGDYDDEEDEDVVDPDAVVDPNPSSWTKTTNTTYDSFVVNWEPCAIAEGYNVYFEDFG